MYVPGGNHGYRGGLPAAMCHTTRNESLRYLDNGDTIGTIWYL
jgi:hypothetical protein